MKNKENSIRKVSRRGFLPFLAGLLVPLVGFSRNNSEKKTDDVVYDTMLTADGELVKVARRNVQKTKKRSKRLSNSSLRGWLKKEID